MAQVKNLIFILFVFAHTRLQKTNKGDIKSFQSGKCIIGRVEWICISIPSFPHPSSLSRILEPYIVSSEAEVGFNIQVLPRSIVKRDNATDNHRERHAYDIQFTFHAPFLKDFSPTKFKKSP